MMPDRETMAQRDLSELINHLSYKFKDINLLFEALRHSSFVNEQLASDLRDNERLEFLGDAVLNLAIGHILMERTPDLREGDLSRMRANLVNESQLAWVARKINLGAHIQLGKGELQSAGQGKESILANAFEAVIAAIYLDGGYDSVRNTISRHFSPLIDRDIASTKHSDYKSQLQELVQTTHGITPSYTVIGETGPDHSKTFNVRLVIEHLTAEGEGRSKKIAEQDAARCALEMLGKDGSE